MLFGVLFWFWVWYHLTGAGAILYNEHKAKKKANYKPSIWCRISNRLPAWSNKPYWGSEPNFMIKAMNTPVAMRTRAQKRVVKKMNRVIDPYW